LTTKKHQPKSLTISQAEIVTLALFLLGGDQRPVDTEDVAVKAFELAPDRFRWRKYPDQINLELVRVFLSDAKKTEGGTLVNGSGKTGWMLTPRGVKWANETKKDRLVMDRPKAASRAGSVDANRRSQERDRLRRTDGWRQWLTGDHGLTPIQAREVLRIDSYSTVPVQRVKLARLRGLFISDAELTSFLEAAAAALGLEH
jgi:hypothetical protein